MDSSKGEGILAAGESESKIQGMRSFSSKDAPLRADTIDLKCLDIELDKHMREGMFKGKVEAPREDWEIDISKLLLRYEVARGTYGTVYRAEYDGRDVAVKLLDWGGDEFTTEAETAALRASFQKEVAVWHELDHPNVTKFIGASISTGELKLQQKHSTSNGSKPLPTRACCVVVEYIPGGTLKQFLIKNMRKKLPYKTVIQLALGLAKGLSYLHSKKIVHRDVKTENMLLDSNQELKIADFGVARVEAQNPNDMTGETGTLGYMAPEVLNGKPYNRKCDVYSFSICLWEIYCCDMPYPNLSFAEVSSAVVRQDLRPDIPRCCPSTLASIMKKCWDPSSEKRPEMEEVVRLLQAIDPSKGRGMIPDDKSSGCIHLFRSCGL
ncbi:Serine/threonine-protein kinase HT1 [Platanthera zijinensis]|uniref:Serine/threonine-protein kinase HT1 n=1 Tax=Platanthera zijinensis TaxID=2320716 RepID=A0AAP0BM83_9ASPA